MMFLPSLPKAEVESIGAYRIILMSGDGDWYVLARRPEFTDAAIRAWVYVTREAINGWHISQEKWNPPEYRATLTYEHPTCGTQVMMIGVIGGMDS